jgi:hypothetical protein
MKKILTSILAFAFASFTFGQSLRIFDLGVDVTNDTVVVPIVAGSAMVNDLEIHNTSAVAVDFKVGRIITPIDSCANVYFCTGTLCYSPQTALVWYPSGAGQTIGASAILPNGPGTYGIAAHYDACPTICDDFFVKYQLYNTLVGSSDTAVVTINYVCTPAGVNENTQEAFLTAFPNPANSFVNIHYEVKDAYKTGKIILYNMLGKEVSEISISDKQGLSKLSLSDLMTGIYFYSIVLDNNIVTTKKLIVSSK